MLTRANEDRATGGAGAVEATPHPVTPRCEGVSKLGVMDNLGKLVDAEE